MESSIIDKLKLGSLSRRLILNKPEEIRVFDRLSFDTEIGIGGYDMIFAFIFSLDEFSGLLKKTVTERLLNSDGYIFFAYPKKGNRKYEAWIGRDDFFGIAEMDSDGYVFGSPVKFARMVALDDTFTVIGLKNEGTRKEPPSRPSQCVDDYTDRIPDLQKYLRADPQALAFFDSLTPGYRRDWARYVYSARTDETVAKRLGEMENILADGFKSIDLFRRGKK